MRTTGASGEQYDATYTRRAAAGENVHGEADFVERFSPSSVLDAGCGTGRVGRELARRGIEVVGVDIDAEMLATARSKAPGAVWQTADLATVRLSRRFDLIVMAGNVMIFLQPGTEGDVLANMAAHLEPKGHLVAGFQLSRPGLTLGRYDELAAAAGLIHQDRWSTWDRAEWRDRNDYAVSVHRSGEPGRSTTAGLVLG
jgi:SAM-dependent methyltransferase